MLFFLSTQNYLNAQLIDVSSDVNLITDHTVGYLGSGVSLVDFNLDEFDDLTFGHHEGEIKFYAGNGTSFKEVDLAINTEGFEAKGICWIDFDNDGDLDLFVANRLAPNKVWQNNSCPTDINSNGHTEVGDFLLLLAEYSDECL